MNRGLVSKAIDAGFTMVAPTLLGIAAGVPAVIIAELTPVEEFNIWVRPDSRIRAPRDLAGAKIGVSRMGGVSHAYGMMVVRSLGLKGKVRFIGVAAVQPRRLVRLRPGWLMLSSAPFLFGQS